MWNYFNQPAIAAKEQALVALLEAEMVLARLLWFFMMSSIHHCELTGCPLGLGQLPMIRREETDPRTTVQRAPEHVQT